MAISLASTFNCIWGGLDGTINNGSTAFSSVNANFNTNTGFAITVAGAAAAGADLVTTVSANVSGTAETLAAANASGSNLTTARWTFGAGVKASSTVGKFTVAGASKTGDLIVVVYNTDSGTSTITGVTDSTGDVWVACGAAITNSGLATYQRAFCCLRASAQAANTRVLTPTITGTPGSYSTDVFGAIYTGNVNGWVQDQFATGNNTGGATAVATSAFTTKYAVEALFTGCAVGGHCTAIGASWTNAITTNQSGSNPAGGFGIDQFGNAGGTQLVTTIQSGITASFTQSAANPFMITAITFAPVLGDVIQYGNVA